MGRGLHFTEKQAAEFAARTGVDMGLVEAATALAPTKDRRVATRITGDDMITYTVIAVMGWLAGFVCGLVMAG